jgi:RNA polymerase sigma-70 factor, ECF subfamily
MNPHEKLLIQQAQNGNLKAFEALVKKVDGKIMSLAFQMLNNAQDAEDVYQDVFLKVYSSLKGFRFQSDFYTWVYRIAVRCAIDYRKKRKPHQTAASFQETASGQDSWVESGQGRPDRVLADEELKDRIRSVLDTLPLMQRTVLFLRFMEDLPVKAIAEATGCSSGAVKQHLFRGTRKARKALSDYII